MYSAFGIDHGEVSKAMPGAGIVRSLGTGISGAARQGARTAGRAAGKNINNPGMRALGRGQVRTGKALRRFSDFAAKRPGAVGGTAIGVGGVGALGTGAAIGSSVSNDKKLSQYR